MIDRPTHVVVKVRCTFLDCHERVKPKNGCAACAGTGLVAKDVPIAEFAAQLVRSLKGW